MGASGPGKILLFEGFRFDVHRRLLCRIEPDGSAPQLTIGSRALDILTALVERRGELVNKQELLDAVWPNTAVEENNLTVQISALRRVLDYGRTEGSCIQTVPGRGYRFVPSVTELDTPDTAAVERPDTTQCPSAQSKAGGGNSPNDVGVRPAIIKGSRITSRWAPRLLAATLAAAALTGFAALVWHPDVPVSKAASVHAAPRFSVAILPFSGSGDAPAETLAANLTEDLTTRLAWLPYSVMPDSSILPGSNGTTADLQEIGRNLGVRYVVKGSVRRLGGTLKINVRLIETEGGTLAWTIAFDNDASDPARAEKDIVRRLDQSIGKAVLDIEGTRLSRLPVESLGAEDLLLLVTADAVNHQIGPEQNARNIQLLERALTLDPKSVEARLGLYTELLRPRTQLNGTVTPEAVARARQLVEEARRIAPGRTDVILTQADLLAFDGRWDEARSSFRQIVREHPDWIHPRVMLGECERRLGRPEEAIPLLKQALDEQLDKYSDYPFLFITYWFLTYAYFDLGRYDDALSLLHLSKERAPVATTTHSMMLASVYGHLGRAAEARPEIAQMLQQAPFLNTVRRFRHTPAADANESRRNMRIADGLALAGLRDHVDEAADTDLPEDAGERTTNLFGPTPTQVPGGVTIDTVRLQAMLRDANPAEGRPRPLLLITINPPPDFTLPNAVWLPSDFASGDLDEASRQRLQDRLEQLTQGDRIRPLVTVAWNAESWSSRNLALRLAALGYTNVYWYRGGLEAWDVAGLPKEPFGSPTPSVPGK